MPVNGSATDFPRLFQAQYADFRDDLPFWLHLAASAHGPVLELGCGTGRVLLCLAQAGYQVAGIDHHPGMLARARHSVPAALARHLSLYQADITGFSLAGTFALVIAPCNTLAELTDTQFTAALSAIHRHLAPGGRMALDMPNPGEALRGFPDPDEPLLSFIEPESGNPIQVYARHSVPRNASKVTVQWAYDELLPDGKVNRLELSSVYHLRSPTFLRGLLSQADFHEVRFHGDYQGGPLRTRSARMLVVASRGLK